MHDVSPVFDSGALIALERGDNEMASIIAVIERYRIRTYIPSGVVAQVWRGHPRQHPIAKLLKSELITVVPLDDETARRVGLVLGRSQTSDVVDGHVALLASSLGNAVVYTSDPDDIRRIDPRLKVIPV